VLPADVSTQRLSGAKVARMTVKELEQHAAGVLDTVPDWIWDGHSLPVPVEEVAGSCHSLLVREVDEMASAPGAPPLGPGQQLSGLLLADRREIWVNAAEAREWPGRRRFTIGHELGHWVMHRRPGQQSLFCRHGTVHPTEAPETEPSELSLEDEANVFAAALTMPAELIRTHYAALREERDCFERMCELFGSSQAAMGKRLQAVV
jgi:hypothetical protein